MVVFTFLLMRGDILPISSKNNIDWHFTNALYLEKNQILFYLSFQ